MKPKTKITGRMDVDIFTVFRHSMVATIDDVDDTEEGIKALIYFARNFFEKLEKEAGIKAVRPSDVKMLVVLLLNWRSL